MKKILYYKLLKENARIELPCGSPLHFRLENNHHDNYLAITDVWKEAGIKCYEGYICDRDYVQLKDEVFVYETEFQNDKEYTVYNIFKPYSYFGMNEHGTPMKILKINDKIFHFISFYEWPKTWDCSYDLSVDKAFETLKCWETDKQLAFGKIKYYGLNGFKGLVSLEPATTDECGHFNLEEQLEAAKLGCDIIYECLK